jgi:serine protease Do
MRKGWLRTLGLMAAIGMAVTAGNALAGSVSSTGGYALDARVIDGEVYVKVNSLTETLGGKGAYDSKTQSYKYVPKTDIPSIVEKVSPSVVAIIGKNEQSGSSDRFALSHGTGVIWKSDGWIVTNAHVVKDMTTINVVTADGKQYEGKRTHIDEVSDLALVKINATGMKAASFAPDTVPLKVGETVIAIGTPVSFSLRNTATTGIISGMNRSVSSAYRLLQTDAAINPGNSGGPLVNMDGQIIGINSMKFVQVEIDNLGFSIPVDTVRYVVNQFFKYGKVNRASLGLELEESWSAVVGLPTTDPLTVKGVSSEAARKAGIAVGDVLYAVAGKQVTSMVEINELLKKIMPGQQVEVTMLSDGDLVTRKITLV